MGARDVLCSASVYIYTHLYGQCTPVILDVMVPTSGSSFLNIHLPFSLFSLFVFFFLSLGITLYSIYYFYTPNFSCTSWVGEFVEDASCKEFSLLPSSCPYFYLFVLFFLVVIVWRGRWIFSRMIVSFRLCRHHSPFSFILLSLALASLLSRRPATTARQFSIENKKKRILRQLSRPSTIWITRSLLNWYQLIMDTQWTYLLRHRACSLHLVPTLSISAYIHCKTRY